MSLVEYLHYGSTILIFMFIIGVATTLVLTLIYQAITSLEDRPYAFFFC